MLTWITTKTHPIRLGRLIAVACASVAAAMAAVSTPSLTPSLPQPQPVGTRISFTAQASDTDSGAIRYRFRVRPAGGAYNTVRDFSPSDTLTWAATESEGTYDIEVTAKNHTTGSTAANSISFTISPLATTGPVVVPAAHPLVALYSAPPCPAGSTMRVRFKPVDEIYWQATSLKNCSGTTTMNFYIGGMRASSTYQLRHDIFTGARLSSGSILTFTTGGIPVSLPSVTTLKPLVPPTNTTEGVTLVGVVVGFPQFAMDAAGNVIWYCNVPSIYPTRPAPGGTFLLLFGYTTDLANSGFQEVDLAGNILKETNVERVNEQLVAGGFHPINVIHHEVRRLANGNYMMLGMTERFSDQQGGADVVGDSIIILDSNLQLLWYWDAFDHLDVSRKAILNETCGTTVRGCVLLNATVANDWMHSNSVAPTPDGNILLSVRHQDFVYKIAYANGTGDGHIIWKLGKDGDFQYNSSDPWPWQSHQHEAEYESPSVVSFFDNGNTRVAALGGGNSRGQALLLDEVNKTVSFIENADVGTYSNSLGSAQSLSNGNYAFCSGAIANSHAQAIEVAPDGSSVSLRDIGVLVYRVFRLRDLYSAK